MIITRRWIQGYIDISKISNEEISKAFNSLGFEVDEFLDYSKKNSGPIVLGKINKATKIEGTSLNLCEVQIEKNKVLNIVCGATNAREGIYVIAALNGAKIANGLTIADREIRGNKSFGMLCSVTEVGMNTSILSEKENDEIFEIVLNEDMDKLIGSKDVLDLIGLNDQIWNLDLTVNRSDGYSSFQILKEVANYFNIGLDNKFEIKTENKDSLIIPKNAKWINVISTQDIKLKKTNKKYSSNRNIWLKHNEVKTSEFEFANIANEVAISSGQPILIIDKNKIESKLELKVVKTDRGDSIQLLDGKSIVSIIGKGVESHYLPNFDSSELIAITLNISPVFARVHQKAVNQYGVEIQRYIRPMSNFIFEKTHTYLKKILIDLDLFESASKVYLVNSPLLVNSKVEVSLKQINRLLGNELTQEMIKPLFKHLGTSITGSGDQLIIEPDKYRVNLGNFTNVVQEIVRLYGYGNIVSKPPLIESQFQSKNLEQQQIDATFNYLKFNGFQNIKTYSLNEKQKVDEWNLFDIKNPIDLMMPLSSQRERYKLSLFSTMIEALEFNYKNGNTNMRAFEFAQVYNKVGLINTHLSIGISGNVFDNKSYNLSLKSSFGYMKGVVETIMSQYNLNPMFTFFEPMDNPGDKIHPYLNAKIIQSGKLIGFILKLDPKYNQKLKTDPIFLIELNISALEEIQSGSIKLKPISKFQATTRNITYIASDISYLEVLKTMFNNVPNLKSTSLADIYEGNNEVAITLKIEFNSDLKQLSDDEINSSMKLILDRFKKEKVEIK
ncbi:phenylalanyl-tRNA synthetase subunit beta [Spiroplasma sp. TIUS-1]|uniref:phenylalanine--tRNA ligase subunit beta n=1 Tax=Spiroplasma sp. TIUS-1 TaxID=216963 RepID=UPI00139739A6|nr:phenylalanine--tRNA ligase subunit beta [Spiroplasma sp. TIUS-1]QHX36003.1 phenylalanyl-tRNA synthetase subunit beta [Spiroplasma sp. TIUS-1]